MTDTMTTALQRLPNDLRPSAQQMWEQARAVSEDVTPTLEAAFTVLRQVRGQPELLEQGELQLKTEVATGLAHAHDGIDGTYPAVTHAWSGSGADAMVNYLPKLSHTVRSCHEHVSDIIEAIEAFRAAIIQLWSKVIARTRQAVAEVAAAVATAGPQVFQAVGPVIDIVENFADYVEELAHSLLNLTSDNHVAGSLLRQARTPPVGVADDGSGTLKFPAIPSQGAEAASGGASAGSHISVDTDALTSLIHALHHNGVYWNQAAEGSARTAEDHFTPDAFGLAGAHFYDDVQQVLADSHRLYSTVDIHMDKLADTLHALNAGYADTEDEIGHQLGRHLDDD